jgi:hypothetical protein
MRWQTGDSPPSWDIVRSCAVAALLIVGLTVWGYADVRRRGRTDARNIESHRTDFTVFTAAGAAFFDGREPYRVTNPRGWNYLYPPLFALLVAPLARLDTQSQVVVWYVASVALGFGCVVESRRIGRLLAPARPATRPRLAAWIRGCAALAVLLPTLDCLQRGQIGIALLYPLLLGFRLVLGGRSWVPCYFGGVVLAWPVVVKLLPALPVSVLAFQQWAAVVARSRAQAPGAVGRATALSLGIATGGLLFVLAIPGACLGWTSNLHHLDTWARKVATNREVGQTAAFQIDGVSNQSLLNGAHLLSARLRKTDPMLKRFAGRHWMAAGRVAAHLRRTDVATRRIVLAMDGVVLAMLLALGLVVMVWRDLPGQAATYGLACMATLLISPLAWGHYYVFLLPAVLFVPLWLERRFGYTTVGAVAAFPAVLTLAHYLAMRWTGPFGLLGLGTMFWFLAVCGLAIRGWFGVPGDTVASATRRTGIRIDPGMTPGIRSNSGWHVGITTSSRAAATPRDAAMTEVPGPE